MSARRDRRTGSCARPPIILSLPQLIFVAVEDRVSAVSSDFASRHGDGFLRGAKIVSYADDNRLDLAVRVDYEC